MAPKSKRNGGGPYVTRTECTATMKGLSEQMSTVMDALVGKNLQGGLVLAMSEVKSTVNTLVAEKKEKEEKGKEKREERLRWKLAAVGLAGTLIGFVVNYFLRLV